MCILEGKSYSELTAGAETDKELDDCTLLTNSQGKELLAPGRGSQYNAEKKVAIPLNVSPLPQQSARNPVLLKPKRSREVVEWYE